MSSITPLLRHIRRCNDGTLDGRRRFLVGGRVVGWVEEAFARQLAQSAPSMRRVDDGLAFEPADDSVEGRSREMADVLAGLAGRGLVRPPRGEAFPVVRSWGDPPLMAIDRRYVQPFGIQAFGVHVNGFVRNAGGLSLWVARRADDVSIEPGKYDSMVGGGQPFGLTVRENLIKEAAEEAGLPEAVARRAVPVGAVSYLMAAPDGLRRDTLFCFDLELDPETAPRNTDGEVQAFELWPVDRVRQVLEATDAFKFNVPLTLLDFLIRHGRIGPDDAGYAALATGLRRPQGIAD